MFGAVADADMEPNGAGQAIHDVWLRLPERFPTVGLDAFIVMPNHIHGILTIASDSPVGAPLVGALPQPGEEVGLKVPALGTVVGAFKSLTTVRYAQGVKELNWPPFNQRLWQRNYYEHIIRDEAALERIRDYILANPSNWDQDPKTPFRRPAVEDGAHKGCPYRNPGWSD